MNEYIAFVRAINVGGRAIVRMTDLKAAFEAAGCENVRTYIQSGNVVFATGEKDTSKLFQKLRAQLKRLVPSGPAISFRAVAEIERLVRAAPFKEFESEPGLALYVAFLEEKPATKPKFPLLMPKEALEAVGMKNLDVLVLSRMKPSGFYGFPNNFIEKELGVAATTRNWKTVRKILDFARKSSAPS